ncbi:MAG TPA: BON domain-containing protein [Pirellulaceae bacterium]|nr:BON domain-containing protein [Pirellulaceae bacterium]
MLSLCLAYGAVALAYGEERQSDAEITQALRDALAQDPRLKSVELQIVTSQGCVVLRGTVTTYSDRYQAESLAKRILGVRQVMNSIKVDAPLRADQQIANDVRRRIEQSSSIRVEELSVTVDTGRVTLAGEVPLWVHSRQVERVARDVLGVRQVDNRLRVAANASGPAILSDEELQRSVEATLTRNAFLAELPVRVSVMRGTVLLEGQVTRIFQKELVVEETRRVPGTHVVDDRLTVTSQLMAKSLPGPMSDEEVTELVRAELDADPRIAAGDLQILTQRGAVTLHGTVGSMYESETAQRLASCVVGVLRVENRLVVEPEPRADREIQEDVNCNLKSDSLLASTTIEVQVHGAVVILKGQVPDHSSKRQAFRLASRVRGVRDINNELEVVMPPHPSSR